MVGTQVMQIHRLILGCAAAVLLSTGAAAQEGVEFPSDFPPPPSAVQPPPPSLVQPLSPVPAPGALTPPPVPLNGRLPTTIPGAPYGSRDGQATFTIDPSCQACIGPNFLISFDAILWRLETTDEQPYLLNPILGTAVFTDDVDLGVEIGPRITASYLNADNEHLRGFEFGYFGMYDWDGSRIDVAPAGTFLRLPDVLGNPGVTTDFATADAMRTFYEIDLSSVELNGLFGQPHSAFSWLAGVRYLRLEEQFEIDSFTGPRFSFYDVQTQNSMWGVQAGGRWQATRGCWELSSMLKMGAFANEAQQRTLLTDNNRTVVLRNTGAESDEASFMLDFGVNLARRLGDVWLARAGYSVFYMNNVARAPDQLDFSSSAISGGQVFFREDALAHGLNFGLEARW